MLDQIAQAFLFFSNDIIIIPLLIMGFIWLNRITFYHAVCLIFLTILVNVALKLSFQVPLSPALHKKGYAFPSGHMQLVTTLYTWLAFRVKNWWLSLAIAALLIGIALSLVHFGYHTYYQVLAGAFFALLLLISYYFAFLKWPKNTPWYILGAATLLMAYMYWRAGEILSYVWVSYYGLWGLTIAEQIASKKVVAAFRSHKLLATLLCLVALLLVQLFFHYLINNQYSAIYQLQWLLVGFIVPCVNFCATGFISRIKKKEI
ncbi:MULTISPECIES: phosphatase PAP2 family protein [Legionella]|uniref:PAP2 superfamily protein n=1 Tax=Legionella drozanskii LLAP-1 TaxID=1212489 RepID=A0A0W0SXC4_9GAMM|nr:MULTISPECIES: phosphatase PAP2 family protein [Legionella]KTC88018.1 PAP2 superfamily protein [Legionella drozanskii LLAP-1]PJE07342.1 MAG: phosphatase PAP2 family protein [Legionella sp.]